MNDTSPPPDWMNRLRDYEQVKNLVNGDSCHINNDTPVAKLLHQFLLDPHVAVLWNKLSRSRHRL
jgi:hypothetical protein